MNCHLCGNDRETCGCWALIEEYPVSDEEVELISRNLKGETIQ